MIAAVVVVVFVVMLDKAVFVYAHPLFQRLPHSYMFTICCIL